MKTTVGKVGERGEVWGGRPAQERGKGVDERMTGWVLEMHPFEKGRSAMKGEVMEGKSLSKVGAVKDHGGHSRGEL